MKTPIAIFLTLLSLLFLSQPLFAHDRVTLRPYYRTITLTGFTYPRQEMTVSSEVSGLCKEIYADVGEMIPENGVLAQIDTTFIDLDIDTNLVNQERAKRQLIKEEKNLARFTSLRRQQSAPQAELDEVELAADLNRIEIKRLQNEAQRLKEGRIRHTITAPAGWLLIERFVEPGELVQKGKPVARLGDFRQLLIPLAVSYIELAALKATDRLEAELPDLGLSLPATLYRTSPVFDATTRKIHIDLLINTTRQRAATASQNIIRGGIRAHIRFSGREEGNSFAIPAIALINRYETQWLQKPDGTTIQVFLISTEDNGKTAIVTGENLKAGQQYSTNIHNH